MVKEIYTSDDENIIKKFETLADVIQKEYNIAIQLARILGKRWQSVAGGGFGDMSVARPERIRLNKNFGVIYYPGPDMPEIDKSKILEIISCLK